MPSAPYRLGPMTISGSIILIEGSFKSIPASGSTTTQTGPITTSGSVNTLSGSLYTSGSLTVSGSTTLSGSLTVSGSTNISGSTTITGSTTISGSLTVTGTLTAQVASGSLATTGSTIYSLNPASTVPTGTDIVGGIVIGNQAGFAGNMAQNVILGDHAGYNGGAGVLIGLYAGSAGASGVAIGEQAGQNASQATSTVMIGYLAGYNTVSGSRSVIIGYKAANTATAANTPGSNNIIIGSNISLPAGRKDSINLGGIIFATGSYATTSGNAFTGSMQSAMVGIATTTPTQTLDVSGSARVTNNAILTAVSTSLNFANDSAAASGGVPLGGLYRSGSFMLIRLV
jgi:hypothetical protein